MQRPLPNSLSLRFVHSQVERLRNSLYLGITGARQRLYRVYPGFIDPDSYALRHVVADEYGFSDWQALEAALVQVGRRDHRTPEQRVIDALVCGDAMTLRELTRAHPRAVCAPHHLIEFATNGLMLNDPDQISGCLRLLVELGVRFDHLKQWNLDSAMRFVPWAAALYLLFGASVDQSGGCSGSGFHRMASIGCIDGLRLLKQVMPEGLDCVDGEGYDAACFAAENGHIHTVAWLLSNGASVSDRLWDIVQRTGYSEISKVIEGEEPQVITQPYGFPNWVFGDIRWADSSGGCIQSRDGVDVFFARCAIDHYCDASAYEQGTRVRFQLALTPVPIAERVKLVAWSPLY